MNEITRILKAFGYSLNGFKAACTHPAFRIELIAACFMIPLAFFLTPSMTERALLIGSIMLVLIVEVINTAIEITINRISTEWHELSGKAKDMGSAAVLLSLVNAGIIWLLIAVPRLF